MIRPFLFGAAKRSASRPCAPSFRRERPEAEEPVRHHALLKRKRVVGAPLWVELAARLLYRTAELASWIESRCNSLLWELQYKHCQCEFCLKEMRGR